MNRRAISAIVRKDLAVVRASKAIMLPLIIVPVVLLLVLPLIATLAPSFVSLPGTEDLDALLEQMPPRLASDLMVMSNQQRILVFMVVYLFAPLFLIVPMMVANVIAADSFAGEKERKTMEALLYTPTSDRDLVAAKLLAPWLAAMVVTVVGFLGYTVVVNLAAWPIMGGVFFPTAMWLALVLWVSPAVAAVGMAGSVLVSLRVNTVQEAYQLGGVVVLPIVLLLVSQVTGLIFFSLPVVLVIGAVVWAAAAAMLHFSLHSFRRSRIVTRL